ncbi:hypothetical protein Bca4012_016134 [Brassica carinata]
MQQSSFFLGCNYLNRDIATDARTGYRLYPVQDIDSVLTDGHGSSDVKVDDTFSLLFGGICFRQLKETLKHTMLVHESVFESQIHELHRLYQRQKELMMEMEGTRQQHEEALYLNSGLPSLTTLSSTHWMSSNVSIYQTRNFPCEQQHMPNQTEAVSDVNKSEKMVLDLELPVLECHDGEEETSLMNIEVHEVANSNKLQFDLNEPAEIEEHYEFLCPVSSNESDKKNEGEDLVKGSCWMYEAQRYGIDLNMFPLSSEDEVNVVKKLGTEKPQECLSEQSRMLVQALPCLNSTLLLNKPHDSYKPRKKKKKVKLGPVNKTFKGSDLDLHASAQATTDKGSSSSVRNETKVVETKKRKKSRRICLVKERDYQEISAAETMVDISRKSDREASEIITSSLSRNLLLLAEVSSFAVGGYELDYSEATTEMNLEDHKRTLRSDTAVSRNALREKSTSRAKQKRKDDQQGAFSECEANEEHLQVLEKEVVEVSDTQLDCEFYKNKRRSCSPLKRIEHITWGVNSKRRRGSRIPAADFQHMIINQIE